MFGFVCVHGLALWVVCVPSVWLDLVIENFFWVFSEILGIFFCMMRSENFFSVNFFFCHQ